MRVNAQASETCRDLCLNPGYLSRVIARLERLGLVEKQRSPKDARTNLLMLTELGAKACRDYGDSSRAEVLAMLEPLSESQRQSLIEAMGKIDQLLTKPMLDYVLRDPLLGDMGMVVHKHAQRYANEYDWNSEFEALLAEIVAQYLREYDPASDRCWIAEKNGMMVGSVFVVRQDESTAKLRMLYVDASTRGLGIGRRLVEQCIAFTRDAGYTRMVLWTNKELVDAVRLYERQGFSLMEEERHNAFGKDQVSQVWQREI